MQKTLSAVILLLSICGLCMIHESVSQKVNVQPTPVNKPLILTPKLLKTGIRRRSTWNLIAPLGSRLKIRCQFYVKSCEKVKIEFSERGSANFSVCPPTTLRYRYMTTTNKFNITITNYWNKPGVICKTFVTVPYVNQARVIINSKEHGWEFKSAKKPSCRCGWTNKRISPNNRIVGGHELDINEYPFLVILYDKIKKYYFCDGAIITNRHVLSSAHCFPKRVAEGVAVNVGEHDTSKANETSVTRRHDVAQIISHPSYDKPTKIDNDVAVLVLKYKIKFSQYVGPVCMPKKLISLTGQFVKIMGYGLLSKGGEKRVFTKKPMETYLKVLDYSVCEIAYDQYEAYGAINNSQICTYSPGRGFCQGDSGGPVLRLNPETNMFQQVGIISFIRQCASIDPCSSASVAYYINWIKEQVAATGPGQLCF